ncbi:MAG: choice-of-anchor R domain-containing protein [Phycisphaerales bacterium]
MLSRDVRNIVLAAAAAAAAAAAFAPTARADILATNLGEDGGYSATATQFGALDGPSLQVRLAIRFTTPAGATPFVLSRIRLPLGLVGPGVSVTIPIELAADEQGLPGTAIETLSMPVGNGSSLATADSARGSVLQPGVRYWIVVPAESTEHLFFWQYGVGPTVPYASQVIVRGVQGPWQAQGAGYVGYVVEGRAALGACCNSAVSGACAVLSAEACQSLGLDFRGHGTACSSTPCPLWFPTGACCTGAACTTTVSVFCTGTFLGTGSVCDPAALGGAVNPCCRADVNSSGSLSVQDLFEYLGAYFGACP